MNPLARTLVWKEIVPPRIIWLYGSSKDDPHAVPTTITPVERGAMTEVIAAAINHAALVTAK